MLNNPYIGASTNILCVIGHPIEHTMSPVMHNAAINDLSLDYIYLAFDIPPNDLKKAIVGFKKSNIIGINVTIPHKEAIIPYLDELEPLSKQIGAVNSVKNEGGVLLGRNTDVFGAKQALRDAGFKIEGKKALILGAGGAARAISFALSEKIDEIFISNRTKERAIKLAKELHDKTKIKATGKDMSEKTLRSLTYSVDILINTTPIGMYPLINISPISKDLLNENLFIFDIIYNPFQTQLLKDAKEIGSKILNGLDMFINQGALAFEWWTGKKPNIKLMKEKIIEQLGSK
ncbi:MAG: shikimate dehydrogenase [Candidatus Lokiarchaeota archaeon]|nr:shikimate dehydrogenase [Candidatus Lokiarchaeota archaeon]